MKEERQRSEPPPDPIVDGQAASEEFVERRRHVRVKSATALLCRIDDVCHEVTLVDLGLGGLKFEIDRHVAPDDVVYLTPPARSGEAVPPLECRVLTVAQSPSGRRRVGVVFVDPEPAAAAPWLGDMLAPEHRMRQRRRHRRFPADLEAHVETGGGSVAASVLDISWGGVAMQSAVLIPKGSKMRMRIGPSKELAPLEVEARVVATRRDEASNHYIHAISFVNRTDAQKRLLREYLHAAARDFDPTRHFVLRDGTLQFDPLPHRSKPKSPRRRASSSKAPYPLIGVCFVIAAGLFWYGRLVQLRLDAADPAGFPPAWLLFVIPWTVASLLAVVATVALLEYRR